MKRLSDLLLAFGIAVTLLACAGKTNQDTKETAPDENVAAEAKEKGVTRAYISMQRAAKIGKPIIFAIGNAPTALVSLYEMYQSGEFKPDFIIGVPVGFVNVEVSKELIMSTDIPYIVNEGRKGGSNIAAAICNALLYQM